MRQVLGSLPQLVVMAVIVNTALFAPIAGALALLALLIFGVSFQGFVTFGATLGAFEGVVAWWTLLLVPSLAYAACMMPWGPKE